MYGRIYNACRTRRIFAPYGGQIEKLAVNMDKRIKFKGTI